MKIATYIQMTAVAALMTGAIPALAQTAPSNGATTNKPASSATVHNNVNTNTSSSNVTGGAYVVPNDPQRGVTVRGNVNTNAVITDQRDGTAVHGETRAAVQAEIDQWKLHNPNQPVPHSLQDRLSNAISTTDDRYTDRPMRIAPAR